MPYFKPKYRSKIYRDFKEIDLKSYRAQIRFYEEQESKIHTLPFDERFELLVYYVDALFEVGFYKKHLLMVDLVLQDVINQNIFLFQNEDIFQKMLFRKAAAYFNLKQYEEASYVLKEIVKINPRNKEARQFLKKCLYQLLPSYVNISRAIGTSLLLIVLLIMGLEVLFVKPFYRLYLEEVVLGRNILLAVSVILIFAGSLLHRIRVNKQIDKWSDQLFSSK